jgi:transposase
MEKIIIEERHRYPLAFKHSVIKEYLAGGIGYRALLKKYDIKSNGSIIHWMRQLGYLENEEKGRTLPPVELSPLPPKNKATTPLNESQEQRIKELERLLEDEQLRSEAYSRIIDIAEKEYNIPIRKKPNTK